MVLDILIQTVHHILKKYSSSKCKQTVCLHTDLTSTLLVFKYYLLFKTRVGVFLSYLKCECATQAFQI
jgi:hypothetical protein